jgi:hypothetical protein
MNARTLRYFTIADVTLLPAFILWFIWQLQFTARWTWIVFVVWMLLSFVLHHDTPKTLGWRADNLWPATKQALLFFGAMILGLLAIGAAFGSPLRLPPNLISWHRLWSYFAFCVLQQVLLNSLVHNRMLSLVSRQWVAAFLTGLIFAACHWPNPVLVPLTLIGGSAMAWMFGKQRNIIPLAIGQAILGSIIFWAFPVAWHHHLRVGPGYYSSWLPVPTGWRGAAATSAAESVYRGLGGGELSQW